MRSSIFNSNYLPIWSFFISFIGLTLMWEMVVRHHYNPPLKIAKIENKEIEAKKYDWVIFGNCLVLNGISPKTIISTWNNNTNLDIEYPKIINISQHENSPLAYFSYLKKANHYPKIIFANVSSWLNGTNFKMEAEQIIDADPLNLFNNNEKQYNNELENNADRGSFSNEIENNLRNITSNYIKQSNKRYHLFDYLLFLTQLFQSFDLRDSLYNIRMQSWFRISSMEIDNFGHLGLHVDYNEDWLRAQDIMAEKQILRIRAGKFLNEIYWEELKNYIHEFQSKGTKIVLMRMPEHRYIRVVNDDIYNIDNKMIELAHSNNIDLIDFPDIMESDIRLFDAVHPDFEGSVVISKTLAKWVYKNRPEWLIPAQ